MEIDDIYTGHETAPWEKSRAFNSHQEHLHPTSFNPRVGGTTMKVSNPSTHEIFIKHCKDCIGALNMCYTWNNEIEQALHYHQNGDKMAEEIKKLHTALNSMQKVIFEQEQKVVILEKRNTELQGM